MTTRRGFLGGLIGSLIAAPAVIRTPGLLMPIKPYPEIGWLPYDNALNAESLEIMMIEIKNSMTRAMMIPNRMIVSPELVSTAGKMLISSSHPGADYER